MYFMTIGLIILLALIAAAFALAAVGAGGWSLDRALGLDLAGAGWGLAALTAGSLAVFAGQELAVRPPRRDPHHHAGAH
jgi:putative oxidoreductase